MKQMSTIEMYSDAVVEYQQVRSGLGLTTSEARGSDELLGMFAEIQSTVADYPEIYLAYAGVLRSRGAKKIEAVKSVKAIEKEILCLSYGVDLVSDESYSKKISALDDPEHVKTLALRFTRLFKQVIPSEVLPKKARTNKRPMSRQHMDEAEVSLEVLEQDRRFNVVVDEDDTIIVNGKTPALDGGAFVLLHELLAEANTDRCFVAPSYLRSRAAWKKYVEDCPEKSSYEFTKSMTKMRESLKILGLSNFLESDGMGRGITYRLRVDSFRYKKEDSLPTHEINSSEEPKTNLQVSPDTLMKSLKSWISDEEAKLKQLGLRHKYLIGRIALGLRIDREDAEDVVQSMRSSGVLHEQNREGHLFLSVNEFTKPEVKSQVPVADRQPTEKEYIQELREKYGLEILRFLKTLGRQQTEFKTAIADAVGGLEVEYVNAVCNLLRAEGLVMAKQEKGRGSRRTRKGKTWAATSKGRSLVERTDNNSRLTQAEKRSLGAGFRQ